MERGKFGSWLKGKFKAFAKKPSKHCDDDDSKTYRGGERPLTDGQHHRRPATYRKHRKQPPAPVATSQQTLDDDCSQARASSDQTWDEPTTVRCVLYFDSAASCAQQGKRA
jgi:hypothetical protein